MVIVVLTCFEISITLFSVFEITKGAKFHQLNSLHLKYSAVLSEELFELESGSLLNIPLLRTHINNIKQQPVECLAEVNMLNKMIMKQIGTYHAVEICEKDIQDADNALAALDLFLIKKIERNDLLNALKLYWRAIHDNSTLFEKPITDTVSFVVSTMVPLVVFISFFNILFISYISRNITGSINSLIKLLKLENNQEDLDIETNDKVSGELKILLQVAKERLTNEFLISEVNTKLEELVKQRTKSLTRANEELAQFAYRASHDLKSPLSSTKGLARFIVEDIDDGHLDDARQDAQKIVQQMIKLEELVTGILSLTEVDSTDQQSVEIDFTTILSDIKDRSDSLLKINQCAFEININMTTPIHFQSARIIQVLENLITNAIKYGDPQKQFAFVRTTIYQQDEHCIIEVEDNGLGIPVNRKGEIFQMFKRFHPQVSFGSGLGMAIIKKHVDYLGGQIEMDTSEKGSIFKLTLPQG